MDFKSRNEKLADDVRDSLNKCVNDLYEQREQYVKRPGHDFVRERILDFVTLIKLILSFGASSNQNELKDFFGSVRSTPNKSALTLQRDKLGKNAFPALFNLFRDRLWNIIPQKKFKNRLIRATDGTDVLLPKDTKNPFTYRHKKDSEGFNLKHLNALFDPLNRLYTAFNFDTVEKKDERTALLDLLTSLIGKMVILLADRGYESYNLIAHCIESKIEFAVRAKELASNGILAGISYLLPDKDEFDTTITLHLTYLQEKDKKGIPNIKVLSKSTKFDFLSNDVPYYTLQLRIVCFTLSSGIKEYLLTNLPRDEFSLADMKELYNLRWGIELSFRELKYLVDMVHFHALKEEYIDQEVAAKLIMFNYSSAICNNVVVPNASKKESGLKYDRKVNFALGVTDCKKYWLYRISVEELCMRLLRFLTPEKKGRKAPRKIRSQRARSFNYRSSM